MKKVNFKELNVKPFVSPNNRYETELFTSKFRSSVAKLLQLKGLQWEITHDESLVLQGNSVESIPLSWSIIPFSYGDHTNLGYILISSALVSELVHKLLGGSDKVIPLDQERELTSLEKRSLESLSSVWSLSLREALTPSLLLKDTTISQTINSFDFDLGSASYFYEVFKVKGLLTGEIHTLLKVDPFK